MKKIKPTNYAARKRMEYLEYADQLSPEDLDWVERFYHEFYNDLVSFIPEKDRLLNTEELLKEARRNYNVMKTDALEEPVYLGNVNNPNFEAFMEEASDEWEWRDAYTIGGYELASHTIFSQTAQCLKTSDSWFPVLARMYIKMDALRRLENRTKSKQKGKL